MKVNIENGEMSVLFIPENALRADRTVMLDDITLDELCAALGGSMKITIGSADGGQFCQQLLEISH